MFNNERPARWRSSLPLPSFAWVTLARRATFMLVVAETMSITQVFELKQWVYSLCDPGINVADPQAVPFLGHTL